MVRIREDLYLEEQEEKERQKEMVIDFIMYRFLFSRNTSRLIHLDL